MLELGKYNTLKIVRERDPGLFLEDEDGNDVLLPNKFVPEDFEIEDMIEVFIYLDNEERIIATTQKPYATVNSFAVLKCTSVSEIGAFLDWGLDKELFVPFKEQASRMKEGYKYLVYVYLDEETNRLAASSKTNKFLSNNLVLLAPYDQVDLIASHPSPNGWNMIVNEKHIGLVFSDDIFQKLSPGDRLKGYVKKVRPDGKIDLTLRRHGFRGIEPDAEKVLEKLKASGGFLRLNDKSAPEDIKEAFQLSKKSFKRAIGSLYKSRIIVIEPEGIRLIEEDA
ncbi:CvfB family protein [Aquimarina brevivitae]|uniref:GntR family transcriptional regulator n=1 Tax=Aquimarina brevivitae TaxID=323412 RepID=A0A4Q7P4R4_9FLAO|nr:S1-like domain-containing RNA-binding protein [Aquimarina brevivitae]RZS93692.1 hypothetical protein EV197_2272 [Aquimarina brevivitae]